MTINHTSEIFSNLGRSMKRNGMVSLITLIIQGISIIFGPLLILIPLFLSNASSEDYYNTLMTVSATLILTASVIVLLNIWKIVVQIQLIVKIKECVDVTEDIHLQRYYEVH